MSWKSKIKKINDYEWEIEKGVKPGMNVPVRLFLSEKLLQQVEDGAIEQAINVATLPGIQRYSIAMPDMHFGYGFPVGGVAGIDFYNGCVSPGGIGFDIGCLPGNTKVLTNFRFSISIKELIPLLNTCKLKAKEGISDLLFISERPSDEYIIRIKTEAGRKLELTFDHPVLTENGWKEAKDLKENELIAVYPFEGVEFQEVKENKLILSEEDFKECDKQIIKYLKERKLIPLYSNDLRIGILARILGYLIGDGCITKILVNDRGKRRERVITWFFGDEGLEELRKDLEELGIKASRVYVRKRENGVNHSLKINSKAFSILLIKLGAVIGKKTVKEFFVPNWIKESPLWIKANFLAGLFGSDGSRPIIKGRETLPINLTFVKKKELERNLVEFLEDIKDILKEFGINSEIYKVLEYDGKVMYRLQIASEEDIYSFLSKIGYVYKSRGEILTTCEYLRRKIFNRAKRAEAKLIAVELYPSRSVRQIAQMLGVNKKLVERAVYENVLDVRISEDFESFEEFKEKYVKDGIIYDKIEKIEVIKSEYENVYDIGLEKYHNFVANGIFVHNCGVRVLRTNLTYDDIKDKLHDLVNEIFRSVPAGVGSEGIVRLTPQQTYEVLKYGAKWAVENGYGFEKDLEFIEDNGCEEKYANPEFVSQKAIERGMPQLGTLGSGNHFLEIQVVDRIFDREIAKVLGIEREGQITVMIHTGSRGLGHQVASDYLEIFESKFKDLIRKLPDRQLAYAPSGTKEFERYLGAMFSAANYAFANRQMITHWVRESFVRVLKKPIEEIGLDIVYDLHHNTAKVEEHKVDGEKKLLLVHRKGSTRAYPPYSPFIPKVYEKIGQPVLIPGSMGTASYILVGLPTADKTFYSSAHGSGRVASRAAMIRKYRYSDALKQMESLGILVKSTTKEGIIEEMPEAYKNVDEVVLTTEKAGISKIVVRMRPIAVVKG